MPYIQNKVKDDITFSTQFSNIQGLTMQCNVNIILFNKLLFFLLVQYFEDLEKMKQENGFLYFQIFHIQGENATLTLPDCSILVLLIAKLLLPGVKKDPVIIFMGVLLEDIVTIVMPIC